MLANLPLLALAGPLNASPLPDVQPSHLFGLRLRDILLVAGVALVIGLVLFLWVYLTHKNRRQHRSSQTVSKPIYRAEKESPEASSSNRMKVRKKRRRHPDNLPRNPTLGETGGLPPIRPEEPPPDLAQH